MLGYLLVSASFLPWEGNETLLLLQFLFFCDIFHTTAHWLRKLGPNTRYPISTELVKSPLILVMQQDHV
jgi:hypothetical protein